MFILQLTFGCDFFAGFFTAAVCLFVLWFAGGSCGWLVGLFCVVVWCGVGFWRGFWFYCCLYLVVSAPVCCFGLVVFAV